MWIRSSFCSADRPQCVEVRWVNKPRHNVVGRLENHTPVVEVRDSKLGNASPVVEFSTRQWHAFLSVVPGWVSAADGHYRMIDLAFTPDEWSAFAQGVAAGEFTKPRELTNA